MASVSAEPGSNGNSLDTELNVVPFIDLLSTLVLFLLLSIVWVQIAAIQTSVDAKGKSTVSNTDQTKLLVHVTPAGIQLTWPTKYSSHHLPGSVRTTEQLIKVVSQLVKAGNTMPASVSGEDVVSYAQVIEAVDAIKTSGLSLVALSTD